MLNKIYKKTTLIANTQILYYDSNDTENTFDLQLKILLMESDIQRYINEKKESLNKDFISIYQLFYNNTNGIKETGMLNMEFCCKTWFDKIKQLNVDKLI